MASHSDGFIATMQWTLPGLLDKKLWRKFRLTFAKEHAKGWRLKKLERGWAHNRNGVYARTESRFTFVIKDPDEVREMTAEKWELLKCALMLMMVPP